MRRFGGGVAISCVARGARASRVFAKPDDGNVVERVDLRRERSGESAPRAVLRACYGESMARECFDGMDDDRVLEGIARVVRRSNEITAELLGYLIEVERRQLHLREACSSMFAFCVERLHLSESAAGKRITAMRTAQRFPLVLEMIASGDIHLTAVNMLAAHLTEENHVEVLARARHRSKREIEVLIAEIAPRPDVASRVMALPQPAPLAAPGEGVGLEVRAPERVARPAVVAPLSPRRYEIRVTVDQETHDKLRQLQDLLAHSGVRDPADIIALAIDRLHEKTLAKKAAIVEKPRAAKRPERRTRDIPAAVERAVWTRDGGQSAFVDRKGRRCSATAFLEFHHVRNWARGAEHDESEIELRCRAHNQTMEWRSCRGQSSAIRRRRYRWSGGGSRGNALPGRDDGVGLSHSTIRARWRSSGFRRRRRIRFTKVDTRKAGAPQLVVRDHRRWTAVTLKREGRRWRQ